MGIFTLTMFATTGLTTNGGGPPTAAVSASGLVPGDTVGQTLGSHRANILGL